jgi:hypothetical protein
VNSINETRSDSPTWQSSGDDYTGSYTSTTTDNESIIDETYAGETYAGSLV